MKKMNKNLLISATVLAVTIGFAAPAFPGEEATKPATAAAAPAKVAVSSEPIEESQEARSGPIVLPLYLRKGWFEASLGAGYFWGDRYFSTSGTIKGLGYNYSEVEARLGLKHRPLPIPLNIEAQLPYTYASMAWKPSAINNRPTDYMPEQNTRSSASMGDIWAGLSYELFGEYALNIPLFKGLRTNVRALYKIQTGSDKGLTNNDSSLITSSGLPEILFDASSIITVSSWTVLARIGHLYRLGGQTSYLPGKYIPGNETLLGAGGFRALSDRITVGGTGDFMYVDTSKYKGSEEDRTAPPGYVLSLRPEVTIMLTRDNLYFNAYADFPTPIGRNYPKSDFIRPAGQKIYAGIIWQFDTGLYRVKPTATALGFTNISSPKYATRKFPVSIFAKGRDGAVIGSYSGAVTLADSTGTVSPVTAYMNSGTMTVDVAIATESEWDRITAVSESLEGESNAFKVEFIKLAGFEFSKPMNPYMSGFRLPMTIRALDSDGNQIPTYNRAVTIWDTTGTIKPQEVQFSGGITSFSAMITQPADSDFIHVQDGEVAGKSAEFRIIASKLVVKKESKKIEIKEKVEFETGKAGILPVSFGLLDQVVMVLVENPSIKILIEGHTDNKGTFKKNIKLSKDRAESIMKYMIEKGIEADRLTSAGYADKVPIADNKTEDGRSKNRRVEITIVSQ
jgi:outer membrane protein OmpA-like peptidoglycan-associated protein